MCYDVRYMTKKKIEYAKRYGGTDEEVKELEEQLIKLEPIKMVYHTTGFMHWKIPVITNKSPNKIEFFQWGIIPFWTKDIKSGMTFSNKTLNARGETMFEKSSYRAAAKSRRCLIITDGFFEHHHLGGKTYPFHIQLQDEAPMSMAGLWEKWVDKSTGEVLFTVAIVTTQGNPLMANIHNNPKAAGPRMPVILNKENEKDWLNDDLEKEEVLQLVQPYDAALMKAFPVSRLRGKEAIGNVPEANTAVEYPELALAGF